MFVFAFKAFGLQTLAVAKVLHWELALMQFLMAEEKKIANSIKLLDFILPCCYLAKVNAL